jgi:hypothetical protein
VTITNTQFTNDPSKSWAIADDDGNLLLAVNGVKTIYANFNTLRNDIAYNY